MSEARRDIDFLTDIQEAVDRILAYGERLEEKRIGLVHPEHQVVRCIGWELY